MLHFIGGWTLKLIEEDKRGEKRKEQSDSTIWPQGQRNDMLKTLNFPNSSGQKRYLSGLLVDKEECKTANYLLFKLSYYMKILKIHLVITMS